MINNARDAKDVAEAASLLRQARTILNYVHSNRTAAMSGPKSATASATSKRRCKAS